MEVIELIYLDGMSVACEAQLSEKLIRIMRVVGGSRRVFINGCRRFLVIYLYRKIEALTFDSVDDDSDDNDNIPNERKFETGRFCGVDWV